MCRPTGRGWAHAGLTQGVSVFLGSPRFAAHGDPPEFITNGWSRHGAELWPGAHDPEVAGSSPAIRTENVIRGHRDRGRYAGRLHLSGHTG